MLTRTMNPGRYNTDNSQGNSLVAGIEHAPDDVQLIGKILEQNKGATDRAVLDQPRNKLKGNQEWTIDQTLHQKRHGHPKPLNCFLNISNRWLQVSTALLAEIA